MKHKWSFLISWGSWHIVDGEDGDRLREKKHLKSASYLPFFPHFQSGMFRRNYYSEQFWTDFISNLLKLTEQEWKTERSYFTEIHSCRKRDWNILWRTQVRNKIRAIVRKEIPINPMLYHSQFDKRKCE